MGYGEIRLYTNARFVDNVALYQRLGYAIAREEPFLGGRVVAYEQDAAARREARPHLLRRPAGG